MEWWNDVRMLCARYLVASDALERSGPVAAAVRAAGYLSEDEEGEEEEEGSSVEEERHEAEEDEEEGALPPGSYRDLHEVDEGTEPPSYRHGSDLGYIQNDKKSPGSQSPEDSGAVSRRPSQRQQEKAPEGRAPHSVEEGAPDAEAPEADGAGPIEDGHVAGTAGGDSRFREGL